MRWFCQISWSPHRSLLLLFFFPFVYYCVEILVFSLSALCEITCVSPMNPSDIMIKVSLLPTCFILFSLSSSSVLIVIASFPFHWRLKTWNLPYFGFIMSFSGCNEPINLCCSWLTRFGPLINFSPPTPSYINGKENEKDMEIHISIQFVRI